jgi:hypothetical protein
VARIKVVREKVAVIKITGILLFLITVLQTESYHTINITFQRRYFVSRRLISCVDNYDADLFLLPTSH